MGGGSGSGSGSGVQRVLEEFVSERTIHEGEKERERLRSKELWTMMEWVVWLCVRVRVRVRARELGRYVSLFLLPLRQYDAV